jgi:hypothetical protein
MGRYHAALYRIAAGGIDELGRKVTARLPGVHKILSDMRDSGDPDRLADGAFLLGTLDEMSDYVDALSAVFRDAAVVIERMANGASRSECSPELDRVIAALNEIGERP